MLSMFIEGPGENEDVVEVDKDKPVEHITEDVIYQGLEHCRCIGESEGDHKVFEVAQRSVEGCLPLIPLPDAHQMVGVSQVQLGEDGGITEGNECRAEEWQGVCIPGGDGVQAPVVHAGSQPSILLPYKEKSRPQWGRGRTDEACCQRIPNVRFHGLSFRTGEVIKTPAREGRAWEQIDGKVIWAVGWQGQGILFTEYWRKVVVLLWYCGHVWRSHRGGGIGRVRGGSRPETALEAVTTPGSNLPGNPVDVGIVELQPGVSQHQR